MRTIRLKNWPNPSIAFSQPSENNSKFALIDYDNVFIGGCLGHSKFILLACVVTIAGNHLEIRLLPGQQGKVL
jgi:hypothetical protein